jgi:hypothetical protein
MKVQVQPVSPGMHVVPACVHGTPLQQSAFEAHDWP